MSGRMGFDNGKIPLWSSVGGETFEDWFATGLARQVGNRIGWDARFPDGTVLSTGAEIVEEGRLVGNTVVTAKDGKTIIEYPWLAWATPGSPILQ